MDKNQTNFEKISSCINTLILSKLTIKSKIKASNYLIHQFACDTNDLYKILLLFIESYYDKKTQMLLKIINESIKNTTKKDDQAIFEELFDTIQDISDNNPEKDIETLCFFILCPLSLYRPYLYQEKIEPGLKD